MQGLGWVITLSANLMFPLKHATAGEPVCYSREQIDDRKLVVKRVPCNEQEHQVYKKFTSRENVNLADLMEVRCSLEELPDVLNGKFKTSDCTGRSIGDTCSLTCDDGYYTPLNTRQTTCKDKGSNKADWTPVSFSCHEALNCSYLSLPNVTDGFFNISDCSGNNEDDVCNMTCREHYYPNSPNQAFCENNGLNEGQWSNGNFTCYALTCSFLSLPNVTNGIFNISDCTGNNEDDVCNMTCREHYYPNLPNQTFCENNGNNEGQWSKGDFACYALNCSFLSLPNVTNGIFNICDCTGNNEDDVCNMTCREHYYPNSPNQTFCENNGNNEGQWSNGDFACYALNYSFLSLPNVTNGIFNISECTGNNEDDVCNMTCREHYYPNSPNQTFCENTGNNEGQWSNGDFACYALNCSFLSLPNVTNGIFNLFDCSGNNEDDVCNMTCREHCYTTSPNQTFCENNGNNEGQWSTGDFACYDCASPAPPNANDCYDIFTSGITDDGIYTINPTGWTESPFDIYCNMSHDGGWTVFQRRVNGFVDFQYRDWKAYKEGFGIPSHELWLGNEKLFFLTNQKNYKLRVDYVDRDGVPYYMNYDLFRVAHETNGYQLELLGTFTGNSGYDYMVYHRGHPFTTRDRSNCAVNCRGGWWYGSCYSANVNGDYSMSNSYGVALYRWDNGIYTYNLRYTQLKIRPL